MLRRGSDDNVSESRRLTLGPRPICNRASDPRCWRVESKNAIAVEMQDRLQPFLQILALSCRALTPRFGDSVLDFRDRYSRQEQ